MKKIQSIRVYIVNNIFDARGLRKEAFDDAALINFRTLKSGEIFWYVHPAAWDYFCRQCRRHNLRYCKVDDLISKINGTDFEK